MTEEKARQVLSDLAELCEKHGIEIYGDECEGVCIKPFDSDLENRSPTLVARTKDSECIKPFDSDLENRVSFSCILWRGEIMHLAQKRSAFSEKPTVD